MSVAVILAATSLGATSASAGALDGFTITGDVVVNADGNTELIYTITGPGPDVEGCQAISHVSFLVPVCPELVLLDTAIDPPGAGTRRFRSGLKIMRSSSTRSASSATRRRWSR
ncbi:MAG: hypothetical protein ACYS22_17555 [Planctomycetota bacterium]|jgi:hypothetical protein